MSANAILQSAFEPVLNAVSVDALKAEVARFTNSLGFDHFGAYLIIDPPGLAPPPVVESAPAAMRESMSDPVLCQVDPVMQHVKDSSLPLIWDQDTYVAAGQGLLWEAQAPFGYRTGIVLAIHMPHGRHFMIGLDSGNPLPTDGREVARMVADLQLFAVYAQQTAERVLAPGVGPQAECNAESVVSLRELECMRWAMDGKTAWETGSILNISERTVAAHLSSATHKLGAVNKSQAVLIALRRGMLRL